jgi:NitT/TauT family transport system substrate-binding protein
MRCEKPARWLFGIHLLPILATLLSPLLVLSAEDKVKKVTVSYTSFAPFLLPFFLEKDLGFFREEGLEAEFILVRGGNLAIRGLMAGNFDYTQSTGTLADAIIRTRQPLKVVFTSSLVHFWLIAQPESRSVTDLRGKTVAIASIGSNTDHVARQIFKQHGLNPLKDVTFIGGGPSRERFVALTSGAVHAAMLSPPFNLKALEMGYRKIASATDYVKWPSVGLGTREEKLNQEPQEVFKMVRAAAKGLKFVLTQREYVLSRIMRMFRLTLEEATQTYEALQEGYVPSGYLAAEAERTAVSMIKQAANVTEEVPPERVFDNRFVKQVEQELKGWRPRAPR